MPLSGVSPGPCIGRREVARRGPRVSLPSRLCSPFCSTSSGPGPRASLSRRWYARSRCRGQSQRVRAGEPVGALSRDAQVPPPPLTRKLGSVSMLYVIGSRPSGESQPSLVCQVAMLWTRPEGEGWRASRSPESRCSGTPPLTCKRFTRMRVEETPQGPRLTQLLQEVLQVHHRKNKGLP